MIKLKEGDKITISVEALYRDGGDGGGTFWVVRDREHYIKERTKRGWSTVEEASEEWDKAEAGDSPYEDGEIDSAEIVLVVKDGKLTLDKEFSLHWGQ